MFPVQTTEIFILCTLPSTGYGYVILLALGLNYVPSV